MNTFFDLRSAMQSPLEVEALHLDRSGLKELPEEVKKMTNLKRLMLRQNELQDLPAFLLDLPQLSSLNIGNNHFEFIPAVVGKMQQLEDLDISFNALKKVNKKDLPLGLEYLNLAGNQIRTFKFSNSFSSLRELNLSENRLLAFPEWQSAPFLKSLILSHNKIKTFPEKASNYSSVENLVLTKNGIEELPATIKEWKSLSVLQLRKNKLKSIAKEIAVCQQLRTLDLGENKLEKLPQLRQVIPWLLNLFLDNNHLGALPRWIDQLPRLDHLGLSRNQLQAHINLKACHNLRKLDLAHNSIISLSAPSALRKLNLRYTNLKNLDGLSTCTRLFELDLTKTDLPELPEMLFQLPRLEKLQGHLKGAERLSLLKFLKSIQQSQYPSEYRKALFQFWMGKDSINIPVEYLVKGLELGIPTLENKIKQELVKLKQVLPELRNSIQWLGKALVTEKESKKLGLETTEDGEIVILGKAPFTIKQQNWDKKSFFSWPDFKKQYLKHKPTNPIAFYDEKQRLRLQKMLLNTAASQVKMALLLIKQKTLPDGLIPTLLISWKLQSDPKLKRQLRQYLEGNLNADWRVLLQKPLVLNRTAGRVEKEEALKRWLKGSPVPFAPFTDLLDYL